MNQTTIEQSKKLLEFGLNPKTADMVHIIKRNDCRELWESAAEDPGNVYTGLKDSVIMCLSDYCFPCWSLGALLQSAPKYFSEENHQFVQSIEYDYITGKYYFSYKDYQNGGRDKNINNNKNLFDGVYSMVIWLLENGYIKAEKK